MNQNTVNEFVKRLCTVPPQAKALPKPQKAPATYNQRIKQHVNEATLGRYVQNDQRLKYKEDQSRRGAGKDKLKQDKDEEITLDLKD